MSQRTVEGRIQVDLIKHENPEANHACTQNPQQIAVKKVLCVLLRLAKKIKIAKMMTFAKK